MGRRDLYACDCVFGGSNFCLFLSSSRSPSPSLSPTVIRLLSSYCPTKKKKYIWWWESKTDRQTDGKFKGTQHSFLHMIWANTEAYQHGRESIHTQHNVNIKVSVQEADLKLWNNSFHQFICYFLISLVLWFCFIVLNRKCLFCYSLYLTPTLYTVLNKTNSFLQNKSVPSATTKTRSFKQGCTNPRSHVARETKILYGGA